MGRRCDDSCLVCGSLHSLICPPSVGVKGIRNDGWARRPEFSLRRLPEFGIYEDKRDDVRIHTAIPLDRSGFWEMRPGYGAGRRTGSETRPGTGPVSRI
jgi:hypothetical protein